MRRKSSSENDVQAALNQLRELGGIHRDLLPGAPPGATATAWSDAWLGAGSGRLHGRYATLSLGSITLLCFEWEVVVDQEFADGTGHGEYWDNPVPLKQMWSGTVRAYHSTAYPRNISTPANYAADMAAMNLMYNASRIAGDPAALTFTGYNGATAAAGQEIFIGSCYASRANFSAPRNGMATQEYSMRGIGAPTRGVTP